jgi:hypothetical protein
MEQFGGVIFFSLVNWTFLRNHMKRVCHKTALIFFCTIYSYMLVEQDVHSLITETRFYIVGYIKLITI